MHSYRAPRGTAGLTLPPAIVIRNTVPALSRPHTGGDSATDTLIITRTGSGPGAKRVGLPHNNS